jgi:hypothetical protein
MQEIPAPPRDGSANMGDSQRLPLAPPSRSSGRSNHQINAMGKSAGSKFA